MSLFTRLPISVNNPSLATIDPAEIEDISIFESGAYGHWIFNTGDDAAYVDQLSTKVLAEQGAAPTFAAKSASLPMSDGKALLSDMDDTANAADTVAMVFKVPVWPSLGVFLGTLNDGADGAGGGGLFIASGGALWHNYRGAISSVEAYNGLAADTWYFVAVSRDFSGATNDLRMLLGGSSIHTGADAGDYQLAAAGTQKIGIGNANYASATSSTIDVAEFMIFDRALSNSELAALYQRRKSAMAGQGISVT